MRRNSYEIDRIAINQYVRKLKENYFNLFKFLTIQQKLIKVAFQIMRKS